MAIQDRQWLWFDFGFAPIEDLRNRKHVSAAYGV
jgi:hypothetical protein